MYGSPVVERRAGTYTYNREGLRIALLISSRHLPPRPSERDLSGPAGGAGLRELLAYRTESMETDQPEFNLGRPAPASASGSATPTFGSGARDAAG